MSLLFPLVLHGVRGRGWIKATSANAEASLGPEEARLAHAPRPQLVGPLGETAWARTEVSVSSASDKECSGVQNILKGEVAKIITRVWEENQGVARPQRRLGGSTVDGATCFNQQSCSLGG